ncbi:MAG: DUF6428 family protein [Saprospiraceae bacterium]
MNTGEFLELLNQNEGKELMFEYKQNQFVPMAYHITEIKSKHIDSVDCGGIAHSYDETVVQLWISGEEEKERAMETEKALKIFNIVDAKTTLKRDTPIFFEWGHGDLLTSVYKVVAIENSDNKIIVKLFVPPTVCKPRVALEMAQGNVEGSCCGSPATGMVELEQAARKCC